MPLPLGFNPTISPTTENPFCCIGCCSSGDVNIIDPRSDSSGGHQQQTTAQTRGMTGQVGATGDMTSQGVLSPGAFAITTQPQKSDSPCDWLGAESSIEQQIDNVAINILNSQRAGRCCTVIYDKCSPRCTANAGCPNCGCPDGERGCGSCGRLLCGMLDGCCVVGAGGSRLKLTAFYRGLKQRFSVRVISLAEEETGLHFQDLLIQGRAPTLNEKCQLEEACIKIKNALGLALGQTANDNWKDDQDNCIALLEDPSWSKAIQKAGNQHVNNPRFQVKNVLVVRQCGDSFSSSCAAFSARQLGSEICNLKVTTALGVEGSLGAFEGSFISEIISEIIRQHPLNLGNFWIGQEELRYLVCLVLAIRGLALQNTEGNISNVVSHSKIKKLRKDFNKTTNCLMLSSSPLYGGMSSEEKEDPCIMSMTTVMLKEKLGKKLGRNVEEQLMKRYAEARQRLSSDKEKDSPVIQQPKRRSISDTSSSSIPSLFCRELQDSFAIDTSQDKSNTGAVVRPKIRSDNKSQDKQSNDSSSSVHFTKKESQDDASGKEDKSGSSKSSFWI